MCEIFNYMSQLLSRYKNSFPEVLNIVLLSGFSQKQEKMMTSFIVFKIVQSVFA